MVRQRLTYTTRVHATREISPLVRRLPALPSSPYRLEPVLSIRQFDEFVLFLLDFLFNDDIVAIGL
jgi:hypothetical protein